MFLLILGLVVLGPEKLPVVLRKAGRLYGEFKRVTSDAQSDFRQAFAEPIRDFQEAANEYKGVFTAAPTRWGDPSKRLFRQTNQYSFHTRCRMRVVHP